MISSSPSCGVQLELENITTLGSRSQLTQSQEEIGRKCIECKAWKDESDFDHVKIGGAIRYTCRACRNRMAKLRANLKRNNPPPPPGLCPICSTHTDTWILDHCHKTDRFRGYICDRCNRGLGCFQDNPEIVKKAIGYLST